MPHDAKAFEFQEGQYQIDIIGQLLGDRKATCLFSQKLELPANVAEAISGRDAGVYFDWGPDSLRYLLHVDKRPPPPKADELVRLLGGAPDAES